MRSREDAQAAARSRRRLGGEPGGLLGRSHPRHPSARPRDLPAGREYEHRDAADSPCTPPRSLDARAREDRVPRHALPLPATRRLHEALKGAR